MSNYIDNVIIKGEKRFIKVDSDHVLISETQTLNDVLSNLLTGDTSTINDILSRLQALEDLNLESRVQALEDTDFTTEDDDSGLYPDVFN